MDNRRITVLIEILSLNGDMTTRLILLNFIINVFLILRTSSEVKQHGPGGLEENETTTCDEFSKFARFNPYSVLGSEWMVFYYWGPPQSVHVYKFYVPGEEETAYLKSIVDASVKEPVNWTAKYVLMREESNKTSLLLERGPRGEYDLYKLYAIKFRKIIKPEDVRFKQTGDNRFIGFMVCATGEVSAMARIRDVPQKKKIQDAAGRLGYRGRGGKSYLYQGHHWMPIPEADERLFWQPVRRRQWYLYE